MVSQKSHFHPSSRTITYYEATNYSRLSNGQTPCCLWIISKQKLKHYGFDGVSVYNDMLYQPAWLPLLEIAQKTKRIKIGPAAINPFTSHPINIAGNYGNS